MIPMHTLLGYVAVAFHNKIYFLLMLHVKQELARAQLHVIFILDLSVIEKHLLISVDC